MCEGVLYSTVLLETGATAGEGVKWPAVYGHAGEAVRGAGMGQDQAGGGGGGGFVSRVVDGGCEQRALVISRAISTLLGDLPRRGQSTTGPAGAR